MRDDVATWGACCGRQEALWPVIAVAGDVFRVAGVKGACGADERVVFSRAMGGG